MKILKKIIPCLVLAAAISAYAEPVAEWKLDGKRDVGPKQTIPLDAHAPTASAVSILMDQSFYSAAATGLGDKWQGFLANGYLDIGQGSGGGSKNQHGLLTKSDSEDESKHHPYGNAAYDFYFGFVGLGSGSQGGTVYLVVSPKGWEAGTPRAALFGTGHFGGRTALWLENGTLNFVAGQGGSGKQKATATVATAWETGKWYFIAASWSGGQNPVLYVQEMDSADPTKSPKAVVGTASGPVPMLTEQPHFDPIVIGAQWVNSGGPDSRFTADGANARIAYARLDNIYSTSEVMETVFQALQSK